MAERRTTVSLEAHGSELALVGELNFVTVTQVLDAGRRAIAAVAGARAVLDLSRVTRTDSAGLALVVDWIRTARARGLELQLRAVPPQLAEIAGISGLSDLFPGGDARAS
jgi:phospholipid transport system transporter-binding protein